LPLHATLKVYNILGQEVHTLLDQVQEAGYHTVTWAGTDSRGIPVSSSIYFYRLTISAVNTEHESGFSSILFTDTKRMLLLK
jgi:flagellar hook assembly protein FlgD